MATVSSRRSTFAVRTRDGLAFEKGFSEVSTALLGHLKVEARDLLPELIEKMHAPSSAAAALVRGSESRGPGM